MKSLLTRSLVAVGAWLSLTAAAQTPAAVEQIDALKASPGNFRLLLENERVRVVEYAIRPGERDQPHTHLRGESRRHDLVGAGAAPHGRECRPHARQDRPGRSEMRG